MIIFSPRAVLSNPLSTPFPLLSYTCSIPHTATHPIWQLRMQKDQPGHQRWLLGLQTKLNWETTVVDFFPVVLIRLCCSFFRILRPWAACGFSGKRNSLEREDVAIRKRTQRFVNSQSAHLRNLSVERASPTQGHDVVLGCTDPISQCCLLNISDELYRTVQTTLPRLRNHVRACSSSNRTLCCSTVCHFQV